MEGTENSVLPRGESVSRTQAVNFMRVTVLLPSCPPPLGAVGHSWGGFLRQQNLQPT